MFVYVCVCACAHMCTGRCLYVCAYVCQISFCFLLLHMQKTVIRCLSYANMSFLLICITGCT